MGTHDGAGMAMIVTGALFLVAALLVPLSADAVFATFALTGLVLAAGGIWVLESRRRR